MFILMISIIIALIIVIFAVQNAAIVPVQFMTWSTDLPLVLIIFCSVFAGALLMFCLALWRQLKHQIGKRPKLELKNKLSKKEKSAKDAGKSVKAENAETVVKEKAEKAENTAENDPIDLSGLKQPLEGNKAQGQIQASAEEPQKK